MAPQSHITASSFIPSNGGGNQLIVNNLHKYLTARCAYRHRAVFYIRVK